MEELIAYDHQIFYWINSTLTHGVLDVFFPLVTDLHKTVWFKILLPLILLGLFVKKFKRKGMICFIGALVCVAVTDLTGGQLLKKGIERERPFKTTGLTVHLKSLASGYSFPSNHALNTFGIAAYVSFFIPAAFPVFYGIAFIVAYSRVYNGVHFPSDVIAGALLGVFLGTLIAFQFWWVMNLKSKEEL